MGAAGGGANIIQMLLPIIMGMLNKSNNDGQAQLGNILGNQDMLEQLAGQQLGLNEQTKTIEDVIAQFGPMANNLDLSSLGVAAGSPQMGGSSPIGSDQPLPQLFGSLASLTGGAGVPGGCAVHTPTAIPPKDDIKDALQRIEENQIPLEEFNELRSRLSLVEEAIGTKEPDSNDDKG